MSSYLEILFFIVVLFTAAQGSCTSNCPAPCSCSGRNLTTSISGMNQACYVNCSSLNLVSAIEIQGVPASWINLSNNEITSVEVVASNNYIVIELDLSHNNIKSLSSSTFQGMSNLEVLNLANNQIKTIPANIFKDLSNLRELHLNDNNITSLPSQLLPTGTPLDILNLQNNELTILNEETLNGFLSQVSNLSLLGNPWLCNCQLSWLQNWIRANQATVSDLTLVVCETPSTAYNQQLLNVDLSLARCADSYISCTKNDSTNEKIFIVWEYTNLNDSLVESQSNCSTICFTKGFYYGLYLPNEQSCLCGRKDSEGFVYNRNQTEWGLCMQACTTGATTACGRQVVGDSIFHASPQISFSGLRIYSVYEEIELTLTLQQEDIPLDFMWNFNDRDTTVIIATKSQTVQHRFFASGEYMVTVVAMNGLGSETFVMTIKVEEPVQGLSVQCPAEVSPGEEPQVEVGLVKGSNPTLIWSLSKDGGDSIQDESFCPTGSHYFASKRICYKVYHQGLNWETARTNCQNQAGDLAVVGSNLVQNFLLNNVSTSLSGKYWIGLSDKQLEGTFMYVNGFGLNQFQPWAAESLHQTYPFNYFYDCVYLNTSGLWVNTNCSDVYPYVCQFTSPDKLNPPQHYSAGVMEFESNSVNYKNATIDEDYAPTIIHKRYTLLFPGLWITRSGKINRFEAITSNPTTSAIGELLTNFSFRIYRPTCLSSENLIHPGCTSHPTAYSSCSANSCSSYQPTQCDDGLKYCPYSPNCREQVSPCNWYNEDISNIPLTHSAGIPEYSLVKSYNIEIDNELMLNHLTIEDGIEVEENDVIAIGFDSYKSIGNFTNNPSILKLKCLESNLSRWRQDAMLFESGDPSTLSGSTPHSWLRSLWCSIRVHYSQPSITNLQSKFMKQNDPGEYNYQVYANNSISNTQAVNPPVNCTIRVRNEIQEIVLQNPSVFVDDQDTVYVALGDEVSLSFEIIGGGENTMTNWTLSSEGSETPASRDEVVNSTCVIETSCTYTSNRTFNFTNIGNTTVVIEGSNGISTSRTQIRIITEEAITGIKILPDGLTRILVGVSQVFESSYETGTNVTTEWIVDNLEKFKVVQQTYNVLFRKPSTYQIKMVVKNHVSELNQTINLLVEERNLLTGFSFDSSNPTFIQSGMLQQFGMEIHVDMNIDVRVTWYFEGRPETPLIFTQPHTGFPNVPGQQYQVILSSFFNKTFPVSGAKSIRVVVEDDYDDIQDRSSEVDVRDVLTSLEVGLDGGFVPAVAELLQFRATVTPSSYKTQFTFNWGEDVDPVTSTNQVEGHTYMGIGTYNVTVEADNGVSMLYAWKLIRVYHRVTGLTVTTDGPTELNENTMITTTVNNYDSTEISYNFDTEAIPDSGFENLTTQTQRSVLFVDPMRYNVTVTVRNPISQETVVTEIHVFELQIESVEFPQGCSETNVSVLFQAVMPTNRVDLFKFDWDFRDGITEPTITGDNNITHTFTTDEDFLSTVRVTSIRTTRFTEKNFTICVQKPIPIFSLSTSVPVIKTGLPINFTTTPSIGGTNVQVYLEFGDGSTVVQYSVSDLISHTYTSPGNYTVLLHARNLVSTQNVSCMAVVQDAVADISVTTNSGYETSVPVNRLIEYTARYTGTDATVHWNFRDGTMETGNPVSHTYNNRDTYILKVNISNAISSASVNTKIDVSSAVSGITLDPPPPIVEVGTTVNIQASAPLGTSYTFYWKVYPSSNEMWDKRGPDKLFSSLFSTPGNYSIVMKVENQASSVNYTETIVVAELLTNLEIGSNQIVPDDYAPINENVSLFILLHDGSPLSDNTFGNTEFISVEWIVKMNRNTVATKNETTLVHIFTMIGTYLIEANVSNTISNFIRTTNLNLIERIGNISFTKTGLPHAIITGEAAVLTVHSQGTNVEYLWKPDINSDIIDDLMTPHFTHVYPEPGYYQIQVELTNKLGRVIQNYLLYVQDTIKGLKVRHIDAIKPFYVGHQLNAKFEATVLNGSNVLYTWQYFNDDNGFVSGKRIISSNLIYWNFSMPATYRLNIKAQNNVSVEELNQTVIVIEPVIGLTLSVSKLLITTNSSITAIANILSGIDVSYLFDFGDNSPTTGGNIINSTQALAVHEYKTDGRFMIVVESFNNATLINATELIVVRDPIKGLQINGLHDDQYILANKKYVVSASILEGTEVTFDWLITLPDSTTIMHSNISMLTETFSDTGSHTLEVTANNFVNKTSETIQFTVLRTPRFQVELVTKDELYLNDTVTIDVMPITGTNVLYDVDFADGSLIIYNSTDLTFSHAYTQDGTYTITVSGHNRAALTNNTVNVTIKKLECNAPKLSFVGSGLQSQYYRSRSLYLETKINLFDCTAYTVRYQWAIFKQDDCNVINEDNKVLIPVLTFYNQLNLAPLTLDVSKYCVRVTASYIDTPLFDSIYSIIEIISTPLAVVINGGTYRFVSHSEKVVLDASTSFDPDLAGDQTPLNYSWTCTSRPRLENNEDYGFEPRVDDNCFDSSSQEEIVIQANTLIVDREYNFTVTARKEGKMNVSAWQIVIIVADQIPTVTVSCYSCRHQATLQISSSHRLSLVGACTSCKLIDKVSYFWEATRKNSSSGPALPFLLNKETTTTNNNIKYLVLRDGYVLDFYEYEFKLTIQVNNQTGFSKLVLYSNKPPVNGNCSIGYDGEQVYVLETLVRFECHGWKDEDISPLVYTILAIRYDGDFKVDEFVIYFGTISSYEAYLPLGFESNNYDILVQILVEDEFGTFTVALNQTVSVKLRETHTLEWLQNRTTGDFVKLEKANNPQVINDFAAGVITVLNQESESNMEDDTAEDFETRREIRFNITKTVAALEPNTIDQIQQITTVFKQCLKVPSELQDTTLQNISVTKVVSLSEQLPDYVDLATSTTFLQVTTNLLDIVSYMVKSVNYHVYVTGEAPLDGQSSEEILTAKYREEMVRKLMVSAYKITDNVLQSKVTGEEPVFLNASSFSSFGARTTPATMNRSISNDGCHIQLPPSIFVNIEDTAEIIYIFSVAEQNPYTFGFQSSSINMLGIENISSRVPTLQFSYANTTQVRVTDVGANVGVEIQNNEQSLLDNLIKMVMVQSDSQFIDPQITNEIADVTSSSYYSPWDGVNFKSQPLNSLVSIAFSVPNNNTDPSVAVYIMLIYEKSTVSTKLEVNPYIDVYFDYTPSPNADRYSNYFRLTENMVKEEANHLNYTIYIDPIELQTINPKYYFNVTNYFEFHNLNIKVGVYYSSCQFFDPDNVEWSKLGLRTSIETIPSVSVCYTSHLTSFGSFVISPPIILDINDIKNIDFRQNPIALIVVSVLFVIYVLGAIWCRRLDLRDIESVSLIPLCGTNGTYKYEITVKTSPGLGSGTTANVGICIYGYESRSGSKHLYKKGAFQRGSVDVFQIATHNYVGSIYKIKIWHDNTGLDPGWNVSRVMVRDLKTGEKSYFLVDSWLQVYPDGEDETCLQKVVPVASEEEMSDFSLRFGTQLSYGWEDAHLWLSLIERSPQSRFTRFQRITCCALLLYTFMVLSAMWYQGYDVEEYDQTDIGEIRWRDIAVGAIVSLMVFPINIIVVFMFKKSKCHVSPTKPWPERAQTAQTVIIEDEILMERSKDKFRSKRSLFGSMMSDQSIGDDLTRRNWFPEDDIEDKLKDADSLKDVESLRDSLARFTSSDTGISTGDEHSSYTSDIKTQTPGGLRRRNTGLQDEFWDPFVSEENSEEEDNIDLDDEDYGQSRAMPANLRRTQKARFSESPFEIPEYENFPPEVTQQSHVNFDKISQDSVEIIMSGASDEPFLLPHFFVYIAFILCYAGMFVSIFFIIVYGDKFGSETTGRWLVSMLVALLESFFIIEPIKVVLLALFVASFSKQHSPEQNDNLVDNPLVETYEHVKKNNKVRPPAGFALEKCKNEAKLGSLAHKSLIQFSVYLLFISFVMGFALWDRDTSAYWSNWTVDQALYKNSISNPGQKDANDYFHNIKTTSDMWMWMENILTPNVFYNDPDLLNTTNSYNYLLGGTVRFRQQRIIPNECSGVGNQYYNQMSTRDTCINLNTEDTSTYTTTGSNITKNTGSSWIYSPPTAPAILYWGQERIYDDSGYFVYLDSTSVVEQINLLKNESWVDRFTRVCFLEFTQMNPNSYWFTVSTIMFEIGSTGAVQPSHFTQTIRLFHPSHYFTVGTLFIGLIGVICVLLWVNEILKMYNLRSNIKEYFMRKMNWLNLLVVVITTILCCLFIYKEVYMENTMNNYKNNRSTFNNFYQVAFVSNLVTYTASLLLAVLIAKTVRLLRFFKCWYSLGETLSLGFNMLLGCTFMFLILVLTYAQLGYLIFGHGSSHSLEDFKDYQNSLYTMFRAFRGRFNTLACYEANPVFALVFFLSYYLIVFAIFCRLFAAVLNKEYKKSNRRNYRPKTYIPEYEIMGYIIRRIKLRLGIIKPKQFRPNVRFEGMSTPSSQGSFASIDSFGTCFTPGRISQCSDATGLSASSSDSGLGIQSDHHSISLFDYLTLEHPPDEKPMDSLHIDYLYNRLSSYSVDMMLHRFERVNKLSEDVLSMETKLLSMKQKSAQQELLRQKSNEIAAAVSSTTMSRTDTASLHSTEFGSSRATTTSNITLKSRKMSSERSRFDTVVGSMFPTNSSSSSDRKYGPMRSSSYTGDHFLKQPSSAESHQRHTISSANQITRINSAKKASLKRRPHSDEGVRVQDKTVIKAKNNAHKTHVLPKKSAW